MKYGNIEGLQKKDSFKKNFFSLGKISVPNLRKNRIKLVAQSLGEPATLIDFLDYDFYLAFKTDGVGTKSLIADYMAKKSNDITQFYQGLGIDLIAANVNDLICVGATPIALSDEIAAGDYHFFTNKQVVDGLLKGFKKGCQEGGIFIPCGESPTLVDVIKSDAFSITGSSIGIIKPKKRALLGEKLRESDIIFGLSSSGIHTNGLSLARKLVEKLPLGYFTPFGKKTIGEVLLTPSRIYVKPILKMIEEKVDIHYMSHISGSAFRKIMRAKKNFTYEINFLPPPPPIFSYLQKLGHLSFFELYQTWNMGIGFVIFAPLNEFKKIDRIAKTYKIKVYQLGSVKKGKKQVIIKPYQIIYEN